MSMRYKDTRIPFPAATLGPPRARRQCAAVFLVAALGACSAGPTVVDANLARNFGGAVAADEPQAANTGRDVLEQGGSAVDAAVAAAFTLAVTLPSRAGLGGGGACIVRGPGRQPVSGPFGGQRRLDTVAATEAVDFLPRADGNDGPATPLLARGLAALHARHGKLRWEQLLIAAENRARFGVPVARALAADLATGGSAPRPFAGLREGDTVRQLDLSATLAALRVRGAGDMHAGALAGELIAAADGRLPADGLRQAAPRWVPPTKLAHRNDVVYLVPMPGASAVEARLRQAPPAAAADVPPRAAGSTGIVAVDRSGQAVACVLTMGQPFGTGRILGDTGILAAAPLDPADASVALIATNDNTNQFLAAVSGIGEAAPSAAASALAQALAGAPLDQAIEQSGGPARLNAVHCAQGLPSSPGSCRVRSDRRGAGIGVVAQAGR